MYGEHTGRAVTSGATHWENTTEDVYLTKIQLSERLAVHGTYKVVTQT